MTGNRLVAANLPGLVLSIWLNSGAAKLQCFELAALTRRQQQQQHPTREEWNASPLPFLVEFTKELPDSVHDDRIMEDPSDESLVVVVPQERPLLRILTA